MYDRPIRNEPMAVKHEIKSQLAKLLATEDLIVEHRQTETACFNVETRVLTLPLWDKASSTVYDMLVGHEVGHALFTPNLDIPGSIPMQFVNIVEDVRIEKLMKRRFPGLTKSFFKGYSEIHNDDFFALEGQDVNEMNLADRANLYFKIGNHLDIKFKSDEKSLIQKIADAETWEDVLEASKELYDYCKQQQKKVDIPAPQNANNAGSGGDGDIEQEKIEEQSPSGSSEQTDSDGLGLSESVSQDGTPEPEVQTASSLEKSLRDLINEDAINNIYCELPQLNLDTVVISNEEIHAECEKVEGYNSVGAYDYVDSQFVEFKRSTQKEVNYLVKEFECRKSADAYARATTSRTGVLDTTKLHTYRYNEDLFKKVTTLADGKSHGLVFVLDWSGSMATVLRDTLKQLFNLMWFCKKVNIPFEVYAFTNEWNRPTYDPETRKMIAWHEGGHYEKKENLLSVDDHFSMLNLFTSRVNGRDMEKQMKNIYRIAYYYSVYSYHNMYSVPERLSLSGTPLNEALVALHQILPKFQRDTKLQKVHCVVLTDGEANHLNFHRKVQRHWEPEPYMGTAPMRLGVHIRDRKLGTTYRVPGSWSCFTKVMLNNLKDKFPDMSFIGIRILASRDAHGFIKEHLDVNSDEYLKTLADWKKNRSFNIKTSGYDAYFALAANTLNQDSEFEVEEGATKAKIKSAFAKSLKTKKLNKKVLGEFISLVA